MPALSVFGRQWNIGSDDFVFPGCAMFFIRALWATVIIAVYCSHRQRIHLCELASVLELFYIGMMVLLCSKVIVNIFLIYHSSKGTIKECSARRLVPRVLYIKFFLFVVEVAWLLIGSYWATDDYAECDWVLVNTMRAIVGLSWVGVLVFIIMIAFLFSPLGNSNHASNNSRIWKRRCQVICCNYFSKDENTTDTYTEIADLVSGFFEDVDLVPTDIAAGLLLVRREQIKDSVNEYPEASIRQVYSDRHQIDEISNSTEMGVRVQSWMTIHQAARVMKYALASYGWPLYSFTHMPFGCCGLCLSSPLVKLPDDKVYGDMCDCNLITLERQTDGTNSEIYFASFTNELFVVPFVIFRDHEEKSVVVAVRGTLSLKDAMVDMTATGEELGGSYPKTYKAHKGMIKSAQNLMDRLHGDNLLQGALSGQCEDYKLIICGHSLGAGVAAILAMLMKPQFPHLQCFAFSPPGGLLSDDACKSSKEHTMSVVLGDDLVPRLSIQTMQDLKVDVMTAINDCKYPKYKIFWSLPFRALHCNHCLLDDDDDRIIQRPLITRTHQLYTHEQTAHSQSDPQFQDAIESRDLLRIQPAFYPPGCIMYISSSIHSADRSCCTKDSDYTWRWANHSEFSALQVSPKMVADHMPNTVLDVLNQLVPDYPQQMTGAEAYITT